MKVPFYEVKQGQTLGSIADQWDMKPSFLLDPLTEVWAEKKPAVQAYVNARIGRGPHVDKWGMIFSGHLRQARHKDESVMGQKLTGASYGVTKNTLEADTVVGVPSAWRGAVRADQQPNGPVCQRCQSPMRNHKVYESVEAKDLLAAIAAKSKFGGQLMLGLLTIFDVKSAIACVIGAESGWNGEVYENVFKPEVQKKYNCHYIWANSYLGLKKVDHQNLSATEKVRDWRGQSIPMNQTGEAMQCAGPKLIQAYLKWDEESGRKGRATDTLFLSEIWGPATDLKPQKGAQDLATYGSRQSASSCMRCRTEIPPMLCGKAPAIEKADMPHLLWEASHD